MWADVVARLVASRRLRLLRERLDPVVDTFGPAVAITRRLRTDAAPSRSVLAGVRRWRSVGTFPADCADQVQRGLDALLIEPDTVSVWPPELERLLVAAGVVADSAAGSPSAQVVGGLGGRSGRERRRRLRAAARSGVPVVLCEWLLPDGGVAPAPDAPLRVHRARWWVREAARAGLNLAAEVRPAGGGISALVFRAGFAPIRAAPVDDGPAVVREPLAVHIDDDLSLGASFSWISAALALALRDRGVVVSIEPSAISPALHRDREALRGLMRARAPEVRCSLGWTHYWRAFQRELTGDATLALFAVNYAFVEGNGPADAWTRSLVGGAGGVAPISTFCRDVLLDAGVRADRLHVIPMGCTAPAWSAPVPALPRASGLRLLHITNTSDVERHGTREALTAFAELCDRGYPATLVVRDYGAGSEEVRAMIAHERSVGRDVRLWPVFFEEQEMMRTMAGFEVLLAPFRGEGFGIKLLDAMASGLAVIAPRFGGPCDFLDDEVAYLVEYELTPMVTGYDARNLAFVRQPMWASAEHRSVVDALVLAAGDPSLRMVRREAARRRAAAFTWAASAARVESAMVQMLRSR